MYFVRDHRSHSEPRRSREKKTQPNSQKKNQNCTQNNKIYNWKKDKRLRATEKQRGSLCFLSKAGCCKCYVLLFCCFILMPEKHYTFTSKTSHS